MQVHVARLNGSNGTIELSASDLPAGVSASSVRLDGKEENATIKLTANPGAPDTEFVPITAKLTARPIDVAAGPVTRTAPFDLRVATDFRMSSGDIGEEEERKRVLIETPDCARRRPDKNSARHRDEWRFVAAAAPGSVGLARRGAGAHPSWSLRWLWAFWYEDLLVPFAVSVVVVVVAYMVRRVRPGSQRVAGPPRPEDYAYLASCAMGMLLASWVARLHEGGYANVSMPAQAAVAGALGLLLAALAAVRAVDVDGRVASWRASRRPGRPDVVVEPRRRSLAAGSRRRRPVRRHPPPAPRHGAGADPSVLPAPGRPAHPRLGDRDLRPVAREGRPE